ncbi:MAG: VTT domain-containing protein [Gemmatimonadota bacterium]|nr:MAG: VTT domain-containing protein [Gemmatimonadota bacterium]
MRTLFRKLFRQRYGNPVWDGVLRLTGIVALLSIPLTVWVPRAGGLVGFGVVTVWVNGPISPFLPATFEPMLMLMGRVYPPILVAIVATAGTLYIEYLNYHVFDRVLQLSALERMRKSHTVEWVLKWFRKAPFFTVWMSSWSPIPYWPVRIISPLAGYDIRRHLFATFLGRAPRLWFFAALGVWWNASLGMLVAISMSSIALALAIYFYKRMRGRPSGEVQELAAANVAEG